jgi:hypothetical protein
MSAPRSPNDDDIPTEIDFSAGFGANSIGRARGSVAPRSCGKLIWLPARRVMPLSELVSELMKKEIALEIAK